MVECTGNVGSGSTYVYGYCDATYQEGWGRDETINFVTNSMSSQFKPQCSLLIKLTRTAALALAMSRDGSSGGVIRMCVITEEGVERLFVAGDQLPKFWEGKDVLPMPSAKGFLNVVVPMAVE
jgi:20S proteasome subunit beta 1